MLKREALGLPTRHRNLGAQGMVKPAVGLLAMGVERKEFDRAAAGKHMTHLSADARSPQELAPSCAIARAWVAPASSGLPLSRSRWDYGADFAPGAGPLSIPSSG